MHIPRSKVRVRRRRESALARLKHQLGNIYHLDPQTEFTQRYVSYHSEYIKRQIDILERKLG